MQPSANISFSVARFRRHRLRPAFSCPLRPTLHNTAPHCRHRRLADHVCAQLRSLASLPTRRLAFAAKNAEIINPAHVLDSLTHHRRQDAPKTCRPISARLHSQKARFLPNRSLRIVAFNIFNTIGLGGPRRIPSRAGSLVFRLTGPGESHLNTHLSYPLTRMVRRLLEFGHKFIVLYAILAPSSCQTVPTARSARHPCTEAMIGLLL